MPMGSTRGCLPPLEGNHRRGNLDSSGSSYSNELDTRTAIITDRSGDTMSDLHTKMAHIQWRKHANDKSIRRALETTKRLHERDMMLQLSVDREGERERWTESIVRDELARPAEISEMFLKDWEQRAKETRKRQLKEAKLHLESLKRVERVVNSKQRSGTGSMTTKTEISESSDTEVAVEGGHGSDQGEDAEPLTKKLRRLRVRVKEKRRQLRRSATSLNELRGTFSATSFKTGRGRC
ncbi:unnamed protein product [Hapterophycus canaliculatus]